MPTESIRMYATAWCGDCWLARRLLDSHDITYEYIDINADPEAARFVEGVNNGNRSVPTITFPDGTVLVEPSRDELKSKLQLS